MRTQVFYKRFCVVVFGPLLAGVACLMLGCGAGDDENIDIENQPVDTNAVEIDYAEWDTVRHENIRIIYPPGHQHADQIQTFAEQYQRSLERIVARLAMPTFMDTVTIFYYTGWGQGQGATGREYPFATDSAIHMWLPSFPGPTLVSYLLPYYTEESTRHEFLKHGLRALFDFSGQDYHVSTIGYINKGRYIPLDSLAKDTAIDSDIERLQSAEAASFAAFILAQAGADGFRSLFESQLPFEQAVPKTFGVSTDSLETLWLEFVKLNVPADSIVDSIWQNR